MKILMLLVAGLVMGCATTTLTEQEAAPCKGNQLCLVDALADKVQQEEYEAEDRRIRKNEKIVSYILRCKAHGWVIFENKMASRVGKPLVDRDGVVNLPRGASLIDYSCVSPWEANQVIRRALGHDRRW